MDVSLFALTKRWGRKSIASGQDADALEAVDLDQSVRANEMQVLALPRLSALGPADAKYLNNAPVSGDAIAGANTTGKGDLRSSRFGHDHSLLVGRWALQSSRLARLDAKRLAVGQASQQVAAGASGPGIPAPSCSVRLRPTSTVRTTQSRSCDIRREIWWFQRLSGRWNETVWAPARRFFSRQQ